MIKTVVLTGTELEVKNLGGFNTVVHNLSDDAVYASKYPEVSAGADNVAEIPAGAAKLISTTNGTVYLLGTGKAELTGQDHDSVNFREPPSRESGGGGVSDLTKGYVDSRDEQILSSAKRYADTKSSAAEDKLAEKADKTEIPTIPAELPANGGNADTVNGHTVNADVPENALFTDTVYENATQSSDGLQSAADKTKLDGVEEGANNYTLPEATEEVLGGIKAGAGLTVINGVLSLLLDPVMHRNIFRGRNLGGSVTDAQLASIQNGTFDDLFVGDYWVINGIYWRIVDMDYWLGCGKSTESNDATQASASLRTTWHHLVIMPDHPLAGKELGTKSTGLGKSGYANTPMFTTHLDSLILPKVTAAFGDALKEHSDILSAAQVNGTADNMNWFVRKIDIPSMIQMFGHRIFTAADAVNNTDNGLEGDISKTQFSLFRLCPRFIKCVKHDAAPLDLDYTYMWLRDSVNNDEYAYIDTNTGFVGSIAANYPLGVRPVFAIG